MLTCCTHMRHYRTVTVTVTTAMRSQGANFNGHPITVHYIINDLFMVFFFGIAAKEVTESCLPGGSLNPPKKALAPLIATVGGCVGPVSVYLIFSYALFASGAFNGYTVTEAASSGSGGAKQVNAPC